MEKVKVKIDKSGLYRSFAYQLLKEADLLEIQELRDAADTLHRAGFEISDRKDGGGKFKIKDLNK